MTDIQYKDRLTDWVEGRGGLMLTDNWEAAFDMI
jgi:hypothetical protein